MEDLGNSEQDPGGERQGPDEALTVVCLSGPAEVCSSGSCGLCEMETKTAKLGSSYGVQRMRGASGDPKGEFLPSKN